MRNIGKKRGVRIAAALLWATVGVSLTSCGMLIGAIVKPNANSCSDMEGAVLQIDRSVGLSDDSGVCALYRASGDGENSLVWIELKRNASMSFVARMDPSARESLFGATHDGAEESTAELVSLRFFQNWEDGWSEFEREAAGIVSFTRSGDSLKLSLAEKPELLEMKSATIRLGGKVLRGNQAEIQTKNRIARIDAIAAYILLTYPADYPLARSAWNWGTFSYDKGLKEIVGARLFPELNGSSSRPSEWKGGGKIDFAEGIAWNRSYSEAVFPPELVEIRQTGTMYRDWEESLDLIYAAVRMPETLALLGGGLELRRVMSK